MHSATPSHIQTVSAGTIRPKRLPFVARAGVLGFIATAALVLSACSPGEKEKKKEADRPAHASLVQTVTVTQSSLPLSVAGSGTISAWQEAPIGAEVGGLTAVGLYVDEGQSVKQGQALLKMDDVLLQAQYRQAKANADKSQKAYARSKELFDKGYLSQAALETAEAEAAVSNAALSTAGTNLSLATVRAPVSGVITSRKAVKGQIVQPGAELFRIVRDGRIELNMEVNEVQLHMLKAGMNATVYGEGGRQVTGTVRLVTPAVNEATRLGYARIAVPWESGFRPGMFARGEIVIGDQLALSVPQKAVVYRENKPGAYVVGPDQRAHFTAIELGQTSGDNVVVKSGLNEGTVVITTGAGFLTDGDLVKSDKPVKREAN
jgi:RND family efflux transporter MFP subunit